MKKILMIAVMAVAALTASAQKGEYYVTPHLNIGYANISNMQGGMDDFGDVDFGDNTVLGLGADFEYMVADKFGISAGLDFNYLESSEYTIEEQIYGHSLKADVKLTYGFLNVPILAQYHFGNFAIKAGIQPSIVLVADADGSETTDGHKENINESFKETMSSVGIAIPVGVSYSFKVPVTLDLRCAIPLTKLNKKDYGSENSKMTAITLSVGYRF